MQPLHIVLPQIETAVEQRREAAALAGLDAAELRTLLYQLVEAYQRELADPALYLERLVTQARERRVETRDVADRAEYAREAVLSRLLELIAPALPAMLGPVPDDMWNEPGSHAQRHDHAVLRGFELIDGMRKGPIGRGRFAVSGRSWWIVALPPDDDQKPVHGKYAALDHGGEVDDHRTGQGHTFCEVKPVTVGEAAQEIRDADFEQLLTSVLRRLRSVSSDGHVDLLERTETRITALQEALRAIRKA